MRALGIRTRIALQCGAVVAVVALLALGVNLVAERALLRRNYQRTLESALELARDDIHYEGGRLEIDRNLDNPSRVRISVYSRDEALLYGRSIVTAPFEELSFRKLKGRDGGDWYASDSLLTLADGEALWLRACVSAGTLAGLRGGQALLLALMAPALTALAGLLGWRIARRILAPVDAMTATAASIADGSDLARRVPLEGPRDELWRMGAVYNDMLARLERSFERERRFSADAAHELRTPVAAVLNQAELGLSEGAGESERRAALEAIRRRAGEMNALIARLLLLSRMESGQAAPIREDVDLGELCRAVAEGMEEAAAAKDIAISVDAPEARCRGDGAMLAQAVSNLVDNALRYGRRGGHVWLTVQPGEGAVRVCVRDDGPGMTPQQRERCFDRFWQADGARREGSGLGLSLVERIARLHGGEATVEEAPGGGCRFTLALPAEEET